jgi:hypothetical protein
MSAPSWGPLGYRFEVPRPRRMLSLDGGGIRGLLSLGALAALEQKLSAYYQRSDFRLCHFFDYIAGTSTGAITAAALARGLSVAEIVDFYHCNLRVPLWRLVRASTAAPVFFPAEVIEWESGNAGQSFAFVDGGTTSYNNPAFLLFRMATEPRYRLGWERGEDKLLIVSVGTGENAERGLTAEDPVSNLVSAGKNTLVSLMSQAAYDQDVNCRTIGRCIAGGLIDLELGDLVLPPTAATKDWGRAFLYARYNALLDSAWLEAHGLGDIDPLSVRGLDAVDKMSELARIGAEVGAKIQIEDFATFLQEPLYVAGEIIAAPGRS